MSQVKRLVYAALLLAVAIVLPVIFHSVGMAGTIFLPMHIPILLAGFIVGPWYAAALGVLAPLINHLISGMPPIPVLYTMMLELVLFGLISGFLYQKSHHILLSLICAMVVGRLAAGVGIYLMSLFIPALSKNFGFAKYYAAAFITSLPGLILQIILIPIIVMAYEKFSKQHA